jgi:hypothetical protein
VLRIRIRSLHTVLAMLVILTLPSCTRTERGASSNSAKSDAEKAPAVKDAATNSQAQPTESNKDTSDASKAVMPTQERANANDDVAIERRQPTPPPKLPPPPDAQRLDPDFEVWIDPKAGVVIVDGQISLREGMLEMFACTRNTKEHESIISANTRAFLVHAALLRLGAEPGHPVRFMPEYSPPAGTEIEINVQWKDENGKERTIRAQDMVKDIRTDKAMTHPFVFAGSLFWKDEETGQQFYAAEGGDFICVSNFASAMLDIPVESSQSNDQLEFVAFTERIPPLGAPVRMFLKPKLKNDDDKARAKSSTDR